MRRWHGGSRTSAASIHSATRPATQGEVPRHTPTYVPHPSAHLSHPHTRYPQPLTSSTVSSSPAGWRSRWRCSKRCNSPGSMGTGSRASTGAVGAASNPASTGKGHQSCRHGACECIMRTTNTTRPLAQARRQRTRMVFSTPQVMRRGNDGWPAVWFGMDLCPCSWNRGVDIVTNRASL